MTLRSGCRRLIEHLAPSLTERIGPLYYIDRGAGDVLPSNLAKRRHLLRLVRARQHEVFVESGTFEGDTVAFMRPHVDRVISVELDPQRFAACAERFADDPDAVLLEGDGRDLIPATVAELDSPPLVWLDGHYSGPGTARGEAAEPVLHILESLSGKCPPGTTLVIDDLRLFGRLDYMPTLPDLLDRARNAFPHAQVCTGLDSLLILVP